MWCRYLLGRPPDPYVLAAYVRAHARSPRLSATSGGRRDRQLVGIARRAPWLARVADSYARVFAPGSLLRRKLTVLLAVLESAAPSFEQFETPTVRRPLRFWFGLACRGLTFLGLLLAASLFLGPLQLVAGRSRPVERARQVDG
ncbi:MAG: hypothetical protein ACE5HQ_02905 [Gemmatimonadota bacterium]